MPTIIFCHPWPRLLAAVARWRLALLSGAGIAVVMLLAGCQDAVGSTTPASLPATDVAYLPAQFPPPSGEAEPAPPTF
jgi:hypothetical protein